MTTDGVDTGELSALLGATSARDLVVTLPGSRRMVRVRAFRRPEERWTAELPANFRTIPNKVAVTYDGRAVYPEFAAVGRLTAAGWSAVWRVNWHRRAFWFDIGREAVVPRTVLDLFERISGSVGRGGAWDILAWKGQQRLFIESKQAGSDKLTTNQLHWLESALGAGVSLESFAVYEYVA